MSGKFRIDQTVTWALGGATARGKVKGSYRNERRNATDSDADHGEPAYLIEQEDGGRVLKGESDLSEG